MQKLMEDINSLSQELNDKINKLTGEPDPVVIEAVHSVKHTLTAALASTWGARALPNKENILPNQKSWTETAEQMGVKHIPKRYLPEEIGLMDRSIGTAKGKHRRTYEDPYARGERSGKPAKPDARARPAFPPFQLVPPALVPPAPPAPVPFPLPMCPSARIPFPLSVHVCPSASVPLLLPACGAAPGPPPPEWPACPFTHVSPLPARVAALGPRALAVSPPEWPPFGPAPMF